MTNKQKECDYIKEHTTNYIVVKKPYEKPENEITVANIQAKENLELIAK